LSALVPASASAQDFGYHWCGTTSDWFDAGNWFSDETCLTPTSVPGTGELARLMSGTEPVVSGVSIDLNTIDAGLLGINFVAGATNNVGTIIGSPVFSESTNNGSVNGDPRFTYSSLNYGTIYGYPTFDEDVPGFPAQNAGTINGEPTFTGASSNTGTINGSATFLDSSINDTSGVVIGNPSFGGFAENRGLVQGEPTFSGSARNGPGTIDGHPSFSGSSWSDGVINGNATFSDGAYLMGGTVNGNASFYGSAYTLGGSIISNTGYFYESSYSQNTSMQTAEYRGTSCACDNTQVAVEGRFYDSATLDNNMNSGFYRGVFYDNSLMREVPFAQVDELAIFVGDSSTAEPGINAPAGKIRRYEESVVTNRDFVTDGPWVIEADGASTFVDICGATTDMGTNLTSSNLGAFLDCSIGIGILSISPDTGSSSTDFVTSAGTVGVTPSACPSGTYAVRSAGTVLGSDTCGGSGSATVSLTEGMNVLRMFFRPSGYSYDIAAVDSVIVTRDSLAPSAPGVTAPVNAASLNPLTPVTISGSCQNGSTVSVSNANLSVSPLTQACSGGAYSILGSWQISASGPQTLTVTQADLAGNTSAATLRNIVLNVPDTTAPTLQTADGQGRTITIAASESLAGSVPSASAFMVSATGQEVVVREVAVSGASVVLTLNQPLSIGAVVSVSYVQPGADPRLQDASSNLVVSTLLLPVSTPQVTGGGGGGGQTPVDASTTAQSPEGGASPEPVAAPQAADLPQHGAAPAQAEDVTFADARQQLPHDRCSLEAVLGETWYTSAFQAFGLSFSPAGRVRAADALTLLSTVSGDLSAILPSMLPRQILTRGQAVRLVAIAFAFVTPEATEREAATVALERCILQGYPDHSLRLALPITWAEFAVLVQRAAAQ
jgi:hypothetical protein